MEGTGYGMEAGKGARAGGRCAGVVVRAVALGPNGAGARTSRRECAWQAGQAGWKSEGRAACYEQKAVIKAGGCEQAGGALAW